MKRTPLLLDFSSKQLALLKKIPKHSFHLVDSRLNLLGVKAGFCSSAREDKAGPKSDKDIFSSKAKQESINQTFYEKIGARHRSFFEDFDSDDAQHVLRLRLKYEEEQRKKGIDTSSPYTFGLGLHDPKEEFRMGKFYKDAAFGDGKQFKEKVFICPVRGGPQPTALKKSHIDTKEKAMHHILIVRGARGVYQRHGFAWRSLISRIEGTGGNFLFFGFSCLSSIYFGGYLSVEAHCGIFMLPWRIYANSYLKSDLELPYFLKMFRFHETADPDRGHELAFYNSKEIAVENARAAAQMGGQDALNGIDAIYNGGIDFATQSFGEDLPEHEIKAGKDDFGFPEPHHKLFPALPQDTCLTPQYIRSIDYRRRELRTFRVDPPLQGLNSNYDPAGTPEVWFSKPMKPFFINQKLCAEITKRDEVLDYVSDLKDIVDY